MPARILVVSADPQLQSLVAGALRDDGYELLSAADGREGLRRWSADRPDLVAVDGGMPEPQLPELMARIREAEPPGTHVPIVVLGAGTDVEAKVRALRMGADDYVARSAHMAELTARVRGLLARYTLPDREGTGAVLGQVLPFYGAKGGVGTTTLAINTAIALQGDRKRSVVLIDANLQFGDHRVFLDLGPDKRSIVDAVAATAIDQEVLRKVVVRHDTGMDLLLAPPTPESAEQVSAEAHHLLRVVEVLRSMYDYVVVDLEKRLDDHTLDVIAASDTIFAIITADLSCLKNVRLMLETMTQIGVTEDRIKLVLNRNNAFTGISAQSIEKVLGRKIAHQIVNDYRVAISSLNSGTPFMVGRPDTGLAKSVVRFAREIDRKAARTADSPERADGATDARPGKKALSTGRGSVLRRRAVSRR